MTRLVLGSFCVALSICAHLSASGLNTTDPNLPPVPSTFLFTGPITYVGPGAQFVVTGEQLQPFSRQAPTVVNGTDELTNFSTTVSGQLSINGSPNVPNSGSGMASALFHNKAGNTTGTFQTELLSLDLSAISPFGPSQIRESPTLASLGQSSVTSAGGGLYHIDSFFDVFTEISVDGGLTWFPSQGSTHLELMPEPASAMLLAIAVSGLLSNARRRT